MTFIPVMLTLAGAILAVVGSMVTGAAVTHWEGSLEDKILTAVAALIALSGIILIFCGAYIIGANA